jgi:hypothetical protein
MSTIRRIMMQSNQSSRENYTDRGYLIIEFKCYLGLEALKLEAPMRSLKTLKEIMKTIEETFVRSDEYLLVKTEILIKTNEWREATMAFNRMNKSGEMMQESWMERITIVQGLINEHEQKERRNRLISYSNCISKNLFENDEEINKATKLMWNRDYQEAIDEACKIWTKIMVIFKPELIFAKTKVLQIMIKCTLNITLSDTSEAEEWLDSLKKQEGEVAASQILFLADAGLMGQIT